jgi:hypothetical protein
MKFSHLVVGGILGGYAAQLLGGVPKNVVVFTLVWVLHVVFRSHTRIPLVSLSVSLGFDAPDPLP